jgi:hypothetical protein
VEKKFENSVLTTACRLHRGEYEIMATKRNKGTHDRVACTWVTRLLETVAAPSNTKFRSVRFACIKNVGNYANSIACIFYLSPQQVGVSLRDAAPDCLVLLAKSNNKQRSTRSTSTVIYLYFPNKQTNKPPGGG